MRISEFCGLTLKKIGFENRTINIEYKLQRIFEMRYIIENHKEVCRNKGIADYR